jgi:hypothetical protein
MVNNSDEKVKDKRNIWVFYIFICLTISGLFYIYAERANTKERILNDHETAIGHFVEMSVIGDHMTFYATYEIVIDNIKYQRDVSVGRMPECYPVFSDECKKMKFWVIYLPEDPNKSLIDLHELSDTSYSKFPEKLENFE